MATETSQSSSIRTGAVEWRSAAIAGLLATVAFGAVQYALGAGAIIAVVFPAMYGIQGPAVVTGWGIHLFHGAVLGVVYAGFVSLGPLRDPASRVTGGVALGIVYGVVTTVVLAAVVMPIWLGAVGFPKAPPLPNFTVPSLVFHLVYGVVLGALYPVLGERL